MCFRKRWSRWLLLAGLLLPVMLAGSAAAQTGNITGQVFDPQGAVVPNATVTATSDTTGIVHTATTSSAGLYSFPALPPSSYTLQAGADGFQPVVRRNIILNIAATLPVNFSLVVAGTNTTVEVQGASAATVETDSFQLSTVVDSKQINDLPLILRDPYQLVLLSPGAVTAQNNDGGFSINGQRDRNNNFLLDGGDNNDTSVPGGTGLLSANPDSTQEFRVITNNFDAEFGRNTGAIVDVSTRGGTNQFHGDAYEFGRYSAAGARDFFNKKENGPQDGYTRNDFGASLGGPIWKDHTFFFLNGEVQRFRTTRTSSTITPTAAFRTGRFTYTDPYDGRQTQVDLTDPANTDSTTGLGIDPAVARIYALAPIGQADNGDGATTTYFFPSPDPLNAYTLTGRFDHKISEKHQLMVRYNYSHSADGDPFHDEALPGMGNTAVLATTHSGIVSITSALTANASNIFRAGYNQADAGFFCNHGAFDALLGTDSFGNGRDAVLPVFFNGLAFGCSSLGDSNAQDRLSSTLFFGDTFNVVKGAHSLKFGGEFRSAKDTNYDNFNSRNTLTFDNYANFQIPSYAWGGNPDSPSVQTFEDMVWGAQGVVSNSKENQFFTREGVRTANDLTRFRQHEWAVFAQDTWKVNRKLTLIAGIRYAFNGVPYEEDGNLSNLFQNASGPVPAAGYFTFTPVGPGTGQQLYKDSYGMVEPRIGFALDLSGDGRTAIRGGYGIFHDRVFDNLYGNAKSSPPFQVESNVYPNVDFVAQTFNPNVLLSNAPFPGALVPSANVPDGSLITPVIIDPNLKMPTNQTWNLGIQHQLSSRLSVEVDYVGSHGTHGLREMDAAPPQPNLVQAAIASGILSSALQVASLYQGGTDANGNSFGPMVNNTAFYHALLQTSIVNSNYNGLQAKVTGRLGGLTMTGSYTYSHALDNGPDPLSPGAGTVSTYPRDSFDLGPEYGNGDADVRHRGTVAATYDLPVGIGTAHLRSGLLGHVLEGIEISGIQQVQTGLPFDLRSTRDNLHTGTDNRPQLIAAPYPSGRGTITAQGVIVGPREAAFANPPFDQNVALHRNQFYGPGFVNTDMVLQKTQTIFHEAKIVLRAESYNVFNHPNFVTPGSSSDPNAGDLGDPTFGLATAQIGQNDGTTGARQIQGAIKVIF